MCQSKGLCSASWSRAHAPSAFPILWGIASIHRVENGHRLPLPILSCECWEDPRSVDPPFLLRASWKGLRHLSCVPLVRTDHMTTPSCKGDWEM